MLLSQYKKIIFLSYLILFALRRIKVQTYYIYNVMIEENPYQNEKTVYETVIKVVKQNKQTDLFSKAFLRPLQIAFKTWKTQNDKQKPHDALPYGLKQAIKKDISLNKYILQDFRPYEELQQNQRNINYLRQNNYDNLISLLKPVGTNNKIQLCICICMYSQDKIMLRKTLTGVSNNIITFAKNGIPPDQILVAVIMDGIQKVDPSVVQFFCQMQKESNIYLDNQIQMVDVKDLVKQNQTQVQDQEVINVSNFIFNDFELQDRKKRRFTQRKRQYQEVKTMIRKIQKYQNNKSIIFDDLDLFLRPFFFEKARQQRRKQYPQQNLINQDISEDQLISQYGQNVKKSRPIIFKALSEAKLFCQKYIQTRDDLALLNSFRVQTNSGAFSKILVQNAYLNLAQQQSEGSIKMNLLFITKYKNSGKLSSHNWFFNGLCRQINTQYAVLLDVGLCPEKTALFRMYQHMKNNKQCGGVCGYMNLRIQKLQTQDEDYVEQIDCISQFSLHIVDIQRAQQVQYHFAHLIDKPFEALFKFIHVLPGAFSAYRIKALQPSSTQDSKLMREYFKSLEDSTSRQLAKSQYTIGKAILKVILPDFLFNCCYKKSQRLSQEQLLYNSNVYLAQDRTLCMGIHQNGYQLQYIPDAQAWVDPIKNLHGLLGQRKRWINGSFFAFQSVKEGFKQEGGIGFCLKFQMLYLSLMNTLAFVSPALFLFTVHIAMFAIRDWFFGSILQPLTTNSGSNSFQTTQFYNSFVYVMDFIYIISLLGLIFKSMHFTHRTQKFIPNIYGISTVMGIFSLAVFIVLIYDMMIGITDSITCIANPKKVCQVTFLSQSPQLRKMFFASLPGGILTYTIYKWLVVAVMGMYAIPILVYSIIYCRCQFILEVIFGVISFIFYTPTYLNILNTFALCRIDDISWGTKGLDAQDNRNNQLKQSWKSIKILHVAKFIFWNILVGTAMLAISSPINLYGTITTDQYNTLMVQSYIRKFFMTFGLMGIIGFTLLIKIILGAIYSLKNRCSRIQVKNNYQNLPKSKIDNYFNEVNDSIKKQVKQNIHDLIQNANELKKQNTQNGINVKIKDLNSLIIMKKSMPVSKIKERQKQKWNEIQKSRSKIIKKSSPTFVQKVLQFFQQQTKIVAIEQTKSMVKSSKSSKYKQKKQKTIVLNIQNGMSSANLNINNLSNQDSDSSVSRSKKNVKFQKIIV